VKPVDARPLRGRDGCDGEPRPRFVTGLLSNLPTLMEYRDWSSGATGTVNITTGLSVSELYDRISAGEGIAGRGLGQGLLLLLFVIGALFLIIEFIALVAGLRARASRLPGRCTSCSREPSACGRAISRTGSP
jgi:hypothetical protein